MTDKELFELCRKYGSNALMWRRKFEALLHEVNKRKLYLKHSCHSIFEFAAKYGGVSNTTVAEVLRTTDKVIDKPLLRAAIAIYGWSKVRAVVPLIATEKEEDLVDMVRTMPRRAIEKTVQHLKAQQLSAQLEAQPDAQLGAQLGPQPAAQTAAQPDPQPDAQTAAQPDPQPDAQPSSPSGAQAEAQSDPQLGPQPDAQPCAGPGQQTAPTAPQPPTENLNPQPQAALTGCNFKITRAAQIAHAPQLANTSYAPQPAHPATKTKMTFDVDAETELQLRQFKQNMEKAKKRPVSFNEVLKELLNSRCETRPTSKKKPRDAATPARHNQNPNQAPIQTLGRKCSVANCNRPATENHHPTRQAIEKTKKIVPLCHTHHQIVHSGRIQNEHAAPETWLATATPDRAAAAYRIDKKVRRHWQRC